MYAFTCQDAYKSLDCKHSPDSLIEPEPNHKAGGATGTEVHLQTAEKPQRRGELSTTDISYWVLLISHARHKHKRISTSVLPDKGHGGSAGGPTTGMAEGFSWHLSDWLLTRLVWRTTTSLQSVSRLCTAAAHGGGVWSKLTGLWERVLLSYVGMVNCKQMWRDY